MENQKMVAFLRAKLNYSSDLLAPKVTPQIVTAFQGPFIRRIERMEQDERATIANFKKIERLLDEVSNNAIGLAGMREVKRKLKGKFGFSRLGDDFDSVVKRVLKRRSIQNIAEAEIISDTLSNLENEQSLGTDTCAELERLLGAYTPESRGSAQ